MGIILPGIIYLFIHACVENYHVLLQHSYDSWMSRVHHFLYWGLGLLPSESGRGEWKIWLKILHSKNQWQWWDQIMASGPITSWQIDREIMEMVKDFILGGSKITTDGDCSHEIKWCLLLGRKVMANLDSILKTETFIILPIKVCLVKAMEKAMATHSSTLAWQISWMEEPGRVQPMGSLGVGHDWDRKSVV